MHQFEKNRQVSSGNKRLPPARLLRRLFEQQRDETDKLRERLAKLETTTTTLCWVTFATALVMVLLVFFRMHP